MLSDTPKQAAEANGIDPIPTRTRVLVLQHPKERRNPQSTVPLISRTLQNCVHRVGLSWPSLSAAVGEKVNPKKWAVLYLGTAKGAAVFSEEESIRIVEPNGKAAVGPEIEGIVLLDGNWKQAKTLWWRNAWLLRLNRIILSPGQASRYAVLRKAPRISCLSTIEATAETLRTLEGNEFAASSLIEAFRNFLSLRS